MIYFGRGRAYQAKEEKDKAIADFQTCLKLSPTPEIKAFIQQQFTELRQTE